MSEQIHFDARERIRRRLSKSSFLTAHTLMFGVVMILACVSNFFTYRFIHTQTSLGAGVWCLLLLAHAAFSLFRSGAFKNQRDQVIQEELLRYDDDLSTDELIDAHESLSKEVKARLTPLYWTLGSIVIYAGLWGGLPLALLLINGLFGGYGAISYFAVLAQLIPLSVTALLTPILAGVQFLYQRKSEDGELRSAYLRALYTTKAEKRKRLATERLTIDDEGEIVLEDTRQRSIKAKGV